MFNSVESNNTYKSVNDLLDRGALYLSQFEEGPLSDKATLNGKKVFTLSHDEMVEKWNAPADYELGVIKNGICYACCDEKASMNKPKDVVTQVGASRFGLDVGFCFSCINHTINDTQGTPLEMSVPFRDSADIHRVSIPLNRLKDLRNRVQPLGTSDVEQPLSDLNQLAVDTILAGQTQKIEQGDQERKKQFQCKKCHKLDLSQLEHKQGEALLRMSNHYRTQRKVAGLCLGCFVSSELSGGCSMLTCTRCISKTVTCIVCMEGAAGRKHNLVICSKIAMDCFKRNPKSQAKLLPIQECKCPQEVTSVEKQKQ